MIDFAFGSHTIIGYEAGEEIELTGVQVEDLIDDKPDLPAECWNESPIDGYKAFDAIKAMCGG